MSSNKPFAPAADQNKEVIFDALKPELTNSDRVLEIGSGTGQHLCHFAAQLPGVTWQPTDLEQYLSGISNWITESACSNILAPVALDVTSRDWTMADVDVCYTANTLHIISEQAVEALIVGCAKVLSVNGKLCAYGPFKFGGQHVSESNQQFDQMLRASDPASGVRDVAQLNRVCALHGFLPARVLTLPVNNFLIIWERSS